MYKMSKQILFTTDIFRVNGDYPYHLDNVLFSLYALFNEQIYQATGQKAILSLSKDKTYFDIEKFYALCNYEYNENNWLKISSGLISKEAEKYFIDSFKNYFIIMYHTNPLMIKLFQQYNIEYIDIFEGSVRFLEDIRFVMRSNNIAIYNKLLNYRYKEEKIKYHANRLKTAYKEYGINKYGLKENSLLLCGQTEADISLLVNGNYITLSDREDALKEVIKQYDYVYYKAHPNVVNDSKNIGLISKLGNFEICTDNFYALMSSPCIRGVAALSSGCLKEATYFDKNVHVLSHIFVKYHLDNANIDINNYVILSDDYYSPTFWADILSPLYDVREVEYFNFKNDTNFLRSNVFRYWGYEIGTKRASVPRPFAKEYFDILAQEKKEEKFVHQKNKYKNITSKDISVVVQGAIIEKETEKCLKSIRKFLPDAEIILSTWEGSDVTGLTYDKLVLSKDPGGADLKPLTTKLYNTNRQIISTKNGLDKATRPFALKLRTDSGIKNLNFIKAFEFASQKIVSREIKYCVFKERVVIDSYYTRDPELSYQGYHFHPSDMWYFGLCEDLKALFDIPLQTEYIINVNSTPKIRLSPEQYIWITFLQKLGKPVGLQHLGDLNPKYKEATIKGLINNFFVLDRDKCGIKFPLKLQKMRPQKERWIMNSEKYFIYYNLFNDSTITRYYQYLDITQKLGISKYTAKLKEALSPLTSILKIPCYICKIILKTMLNSYKLLKK